MIEQTILTIVSPTNERWVLGPFITGRGVKECVNKGLLSTKQLVGSYGQKGLQNYMAMLRVILSSPDPKPGKPLTVHKNGWTTIWSSEHRTR